MTHTPGPWVQTHADSVRQPDGTYICNCRVEGLTLAARAANARLIAAAPELLAACQLCLDHAGGLPVDMLSQLRAAVAKATREETML